MHNAIICSKILIPLAEVEEYLDNSNFSLSFCWCVGVGAEFRAHSNLYWLGTEKGMSAECIFNSLVPIRNWVISTPSPTLFFRIVIIIRWTLIVQKLPVWSLWVSHWSWNERVCVLLTHVTPTEINRKKPKLNWRQYHLGNEGNGECKRDNRILFQFLSIVLTV